MLILGKLPDLDKSPRDAYPYAAHQMIHKWLEENEREAAGLPWEVYVTDPEKEPDNTKWVTEVYYPLKPA